MTIADFAVLIAALIPYFTVSYAKNSKAFKNADPRNMGNLHGAQKRAYDAQLNGYEVFPFFAIAVLLSEFRGASQDWVNALAILFILLRIAYTWAYISDKPTARSGIFTLGLLIPIILFFLPLFVR